MAEISIFDLHKHLDQVADRFANEPAAPVLADCRPVILEGIRFNFEGAQSPDGQGWPARKDTKPHPLLQETGALLAAATGGTGHVDELQDRSIAVGVDKDGGPESLKGAAVHQYGFKNVPQREYLGLAQQFLDRVGKIIADGMLGRLWK